MKEEEIAALDGEWSEFTPAERAALLKGLRSIVGTLESAAEGD